MNIDINFMKSVFAESLDIDTSELTLESRYEEVQNWDSLGHVRIFGEIEERLDIEFDIEDIVGQDTVQKLIETIEAKIK
ncbi:acyl carrier protein [Gammaproteobacteria bacterium]|jgi:acyl carrier protein|nr:acyl carrier protein [Gammaproteobacteria bacterium]